MKQLKIQLAQHSDAGKKPQNEDCFGAILPEDNSSALLYKGIAIAVADGMSGCEGGKEASQLSVQMFLEGYYDTPESWSVKNAVHKVLITINSWLFGTGQQQYQTAKGMVTTFSALILKSQTLHLFHIGDTRVYRLRNESLRQLTRDHRIVVKGDREYLSRALGIDMSVDIDYREEILKIGDIYFLSTDGIHDNLSDNQIKQHLLNGHNDQQTAEDLTQIALEQGSQDNLTCQIVRIIDLPEANQNEYYEQLTQLPFPPDDLRTGHILDGYKIIRELHASPRSQVYLVIDTQDKNHPKRVIKTPSLNYIDDPNYIEAFLREEWIAKRLKNDHLIQVCSNDRQRRFLYTVMEYIEGQTLRDWMNAHPAPKIHQVRDYLKQMVKGLRCLHRMEMIHQDLKPDNILIDSHDSIKIIDFGSTKIAGLAEIQTIKAQQTILGTANYSAPEYFKGQQGNNRSDIYSLAVIIYEMLTGQLPYGEISIERADKKQFHYTPASQHNEQLPTWIDACLKKALHPNPQKRYGLLSEFLHDFTYPNKSLLKTKQQPLLQRNPVLFWQGVAVLEMLLIVALLYD